MKRQVTPSTSGNWENKLLLANRRRPLVATAKWRKRSAARPRTSPKPRPRNSSEQPQSQTEWIIALMEQQCQVYLALIEQQRQISLVLNKLLQRKGSQEPGSSGVAAQSIPAPPAQVPPIIPEPPAQVPPIIPEPPAQVPPIIPEPAVLTSQASTLAAPTTLQAPTSQPLLFPSSTAQQFLPLATCCVGPHPSVTLTKPFFSDSMNPVRFLEELETYFRRSHLGETHKIDEAVSCLSKSADAWATFEKKSWRDFEDFKVAFLCEFWPDSKQFDFRDQVLAQSYDPSKGFTMVRHFKVLMSKLWTLTIPIPESLMVEEVMRLFPQQVLGLWYTMARQERTLEAAVVLLRQQSIINPPERVRWDPHDIDRREATTSRPTVATVKAPDPIPSFNPFSVPPPTSHS